MLQIKANQEMAYKKLIKVGHDVRAMNCIMCIVDDMYHTHTHTHFKSLRVLAYFH